MEMLQRLPESHILAIQASLMTGLSVYSPEGVNLELHKPFKTSDQKVAGMLFFEDSSCYGRPYIQFNYEAEGNKFVSKVIVTDADGEIHCPRSNKENAVCVYAMANRALGKRLFEGLGKSWETELSPFIGCV